MTYERESHTNLFTLSDVYSQFLFLFVLNSPQWLKVSLPFMQQQPYCKYVHVK